MTCSLIKTGRDKYKGKLFNKVDEVMNKSIKFDMESKASRRKMSRAAEG